MMRYKPGEIVLVPFPFIDRPVRKVRPALVLSNTPDVDSDMYCILAMITSAKRSHWKSDVILLDWKAAGLKAESILRWKVFTIEAALVTGKRGTLSERDFASVKKGLAGILPYLRR
jgi:mRNA interferase MazF